MKNITVALDDDTYRKARILAAQRDSSVSALVKEHLLALTAGASTARDLKREQEDLLDTLWRRHPDFNSAENLSRETLYERR